jgi:hypothetical protein
MIASCHLQCREMPPAELFADEGKALGGRAHKAFVNTGKKQSIYHDDNTYEPVFETWEYR